ncbi:MAG: HAD family hydrolase [Candidatus Nanopelagicales bacterium]|nr:HAD family hydrolase [Candidatus Nanopelagicales bacterium]
MWERAQSATMAYFGLEWTPQDQASSIGGPIEKVVAYIAGRTGGDPGHIARILVGEIEHLVATEPAQWMPGARDLLVAAQEAGVPTAIVSNSWRVLLDLLIRNIDSPVDLTVSSTEVHAPKPDPHPYLLACGQLGVKPQRTWVVEDSPTGVAAGLAAGCHVLAVGPAVAGISDPRLLHVDSLAQVRLESLGGDGPQDP